MDGWIDMCIYNYVCMHVCVCVNQMQKMYAYTVQHIIECMFGVFLSVDV